MSWPKAMNMFEHAFELEMFTSVSTGSLHMDAISSLDAEWFFQNHLVSLQQWHTGFPGSSCTCKLLASSNFLISPGEQVQSDNPLLNSLVALMVSLSTVSYTYEPFWISPFDKCLFRYFAWFCIFFLTIHKTSCTLVSALCWLYMWQSYVAVYSSVASQAQSSLHLAR